MRIRFQAFRTALIAGSLLLPASGLSYQAAAPAAAKSKKAEATRVPTAQEIADAKAKGLVWVNLNTRVYHKDDEVYGKTKSGKFMTEDEAKQAGFEARKPAKVTQKSSALGKANAAKAKTGNNSGTDATIKTHGGSTPPVPK